MGKLIKKCERIAVMEEASHGGVRSSRDMEVIMTTSSTVSSKKRKVDDLQSSPPAVDQLLEEDSISPTLSEASDYVPSSICSSNDSREVVKDCFKNLDLKKESFGTEISIFNYGGFSRETTPSSDLCTDRGQIMESSTSKKKPTTAPANCRRKLSAASKTPSATEIEEFFSVAEKYEQKRFADKYNYDIVKDVPVEGGRYQWVRL